MWKLQFIGCSHGDRPIPTWEVTGSRTDIIALYQQLRAYWHFAYFQLSDTRGEVIELL